MFKHTIIAIVLLLSLSIQAQTTISVVTDTNLHLVGRSTNLFIRNIPQLTNALQNMITNAEVAYAVDATHANIADFAMYVEYVTNNVAYSTNAQTSQTAGAALVATNRPDGTALNDLVTNNQTGLTLGGRFNGSFERDTGNPDLAAKFYNDATTGDYTFYSGALDTIADMAPPSFNELAFITAGRAGGNWWNTHTNWLTINSRLGRWTFSGETYGAYHTLNMDGSADLSSGLIHLSSGGDISATTFSGNGSGLTNVPILWANSSTNTIYPSGLGSVVGVTATNAVAIVNGTATNLTVVNGTFSGNGGGLTNITASVIQPYFFNTSTGSVYYVPTVAGILIKTNASNSLFITLNTVTNELVGVAKVELYQTGTNWVIIY